MSTLPSAIPTSGRVRVRSGSSHRPRLRLVGFAAVAIVAGIFPAAVLGDISPSSIDTFAATNGGWQIGSAGVQPSRVAAPGPDSQIGYLSHFSDGSSSQGKWLMWNDQSQWLGNYTAAGVTGINLLANVSAGSSPVSMRIAFNGPGGWFYSASRSASSGWNPYSFALDPATFTYAAGSGGTGTFADTMSGVSRFEILAGAGGVSYRSSGNLLQAGTSTNTILFDNIAAVPEPSTYVTAIAGLACGAWHLRGRRRRMMRR